MVTYIIQLSVFLLLFWGVYELFLKKETFFTYNRLYLLLTPIISALLPFLSFNVLESYAVEAQQLVQLPAVFIGDPVVQEIPDQTVTNPTNSISFYEKYAWWLAYGFGVLISLLLFIKKIFQFQQFRKQGKVSYLNDLKLVEVENSSMACTFFKTIYLGSDLSETEKAQILKHEQVHAQQYHSLDLLFFEILKIAMWFNPVVYFYQKQITNLHEYIADAEATKNSDKKSYYESLLNVAFGSEQISFINQFFNHSLIKKRIVMLQKSKSARAAKFKFLILIPLIFAMLTYVSCSDKSNLNEEENPITSKELKQFENDVKKKLLLPDETENYGVIEVEDINNLTDEENLRLRKLSAKIIEDEKMHKLVLTDGENKRVIDFDQNSNIAEEGIPFTAIETVPIYPGCENLDNAAAKKCMSDNITQFVNKNFDTNAVKPYAEKGTNRIFVRFAITKEGTIDNIQARASSPELELEGKRVVAMLPKMKPGEKDGKPVNVLYSLPIIFQVSE
ncbi:M56 family metallopeptidase [Mesonia sp.]|uniref:M56 family metallopeptidase n=1 Tax=Mesonia sp. TaxID=1960830 RepID=UPI00175A21FB|nr:M56 family metallopeptidase [Mesonia sp.]HIB36992.1 blaR1 peptidase M56 [Mesonia sp.]HIO26690.1 blaR1 peptidase M56 [Flavobacteriaceae bacterium]